MSNYPSFSSSPAKIDLTELLNSEKDKTNWMIFLTFESPNDLSKRSEGKSCFFAQRMAGERGEDLPNQCHLSTVDRWKIGSWVTLGVKLRPSLSPMNGWHHCVCLRRRVGQEEKSVRRRSSFRIGSSKKKAMLLSRCVCFYLLPWVNGCW